MQASKQLVSTTNQSNPAKNWLQHASNRWTRSTGVTNSAFLLANVAMPIDSAYSIHNACPLCFMLMHTTKYINSPVKIVKIDNAHEIYSLSASTDGAEICSPMEPNNNVRWLYYYNKILEVSVHISQQSRSGAERVLFVSGTTTYN